MPELLCNSARRRPECCRAKLLQVTSIGLSQLNREVGPKETPRVEHLFGGSPLGNDADQVLLLDHSRLARLPSGDVLAYALLDKNRFGPPVADIPTRLEVKTLRIREGMDDEEHLWPGAEKLK